MKFFGRSCGSFAITYTLITSVCDGRFIRSHVKKNARIIIRLFELSLQHTE